MAGHLVEIESDVGHGLPGVHLVGLPDAALHEAEDRVKAVIVNWGWPWPSERIVLGLSPYLTGSGFDLALACAVLAADGILPQPALNGAVLLGELALQAACCGRSAGCCPVCSPPAPRVTSGSSGLRPLS